MSPAKWWCWGCKAFVDCDEYFDDMTKGDGTCRHCGKDFNGNGR